MHQPQASCIMHWTWTGDLFHIWYYTCFNAILPNHPTIFYNTLVAAAAKSLQSCLTLCHPIDSNPPGSSTHGILQARTLECVAISFSNAWKWKGKVKSPCRARLFVTPWTAAYQAPPSMGFSRQEYWSGVPLPSPNTVFKLLTTLQWKNLWVQGNSLKLWS